MPRIVRLLLSFALFAALAGASLCNTSGEESCIQDCSCCLSEKGTSVHASKDLQDQGDAVQNAIAELKELLRSARDAEDALRIAIARHSTLLRGLEVSVAIEAKARAASIEKDEPRASETVLQQPPAGVAK